MTKEEIISMASEAGFKVRNDTIRTMHSNGSWVGINEELERFAELVAAAERESVCAKKGWVTMSMHKIPLTDVEREGLEKHGLGQNIGKPSQLADAFRQGVKWGQEQEREACAKVLDEMADEAEADMEPSALVTYYREKAAAIRARGAE